MDLKINQIQWKEQKTCDTCVHKKICKHTETVLRNLKEIQSNLSLTDMPMIKLSIECTNYISKNTIIQQGPLGVLNCTSRNGETYGNEKVHV